ncbi:XRE family transcriptional regulator [Actinocorallia aurantiaca]|uniref:Helix-turn-helix domain-containing protein n=1 Tax=Actinocorallia aurantiaca TaxID=46204 RepID=A0ABN3UEZ2_9ACTN
MPPAKEMKSSDKSDLSEKIDLLFRTVYPADRGPYSLQEAAEGIEQLTGEKVSHNTLWKLRTGKSDNPTKRVLEGLAKFFGVSPAYFFQENVSEEIRHQIELLSVLRDTGIRGAQLRTFFELSPEGQEMVADLIVKAARIENYQRRSSPHES